MNKTCDFLDRRFTTEASCSQQPVEVSGDAMMDPGSDRELDMQFERSLLDIKGD